MKALKNYLSRVRLVYRPSQTATKVMLILALVLSTGALITLRVSTDTVKKENDALYAQAAALSESNEELREDIEKLGSVDSAMDIAREELGLVQPDVIIYEPVE